MKKQRIIYILVALTLLVQGACGKKERESKSMDQLHAELGIPVRTMEVKRDVFEQFLRFNSTLSGMQETTVQAMVADMVTGINFKVGDRVNEGDIILTFPTNTPSAQYHQAQTAFESISAIRERMSRLKEEGAISAQDFENIETQYKVTKANMETSEQMVKVKAPMSGIITNIMITPGERAYPGKDLFTISSTNGYKATIMVPETEISKVKKGGAVIAKWDDISIRGTVKEIAMAMDPMAKAFRVEAVFPGFRQDLSFGVTAEIGLQTARKNDVISLPRQVLIKENDKHIVWLAVDGKAHKVSVHTGLNDFLCHEILDGVEPGDKVITEGLKSLSEGAKIRIIED